MRTIDPVVDVATKLNEVNAGIASANQAVDALKQRVTEQGVADEATHFDAQAQSHLRQSRWWVGFSIAIAIAILFLAGYSYLHPISAASSGMLQVGQQIAAKLVFVSIMSFALVFTIRNYSTSRHNYILNQHRAIALTTFRAFIQGASDTETKHSVLLAATKAVFASQNTGYLRKSEAASIPIVDLIKVVTGK
jgi:hypothetical protein